MQAVVRHLATTSWTLIVKAEAIDPKVRRVAISALCEAYWCSPYAFARARERLRFAYARAVKMREFEVLGPNLMNVPEAVDANKLALDVVVKELTHRLCP